MSKWDDAMAGIDRLNSVAEVQSAVSNGLTTEVTSHRGRIAGLEARNTQVEHDVEVLTTTLVQTTAQVDTHSSQIAEHDSWFMAIFERLGAAIDWTTVWVISIIVGILTVPVWYFWVFEQYGLERKFADASGALTVTVTADPGRIWLISSALAVFVMFVMAFILSFVMHRADEANQAAAPAADTAEPAPAPEAPATAAPAVPVAELPPPPAPAPAAAGTS